LREWRRKFWLEAAGAGEGIRTLDPNLAGFSLRLFNEVVHAADSVKVNRFGTPAREPQPVATTSVMTEVDSA
jgi:hypothetical protein